MGALSITQTDRLFWLGRYLERVKTTLRVSGDLQEMLLDNVVGYDIGSLCERLAIPNIYKDPDDFIVRFLFDANDENSVISNMNRAFDNAIMLRDVLSSETLSYVQLALNRFEVAARSQSPMLELQEVVDYIYAFWGAVEESVEDSSVRFVMHTGRSVERVDLLLRLRFDDRRILPEIMRLVDRLDRSDMRKNEENYSLLTGYLQGDRDPKSSDLVECVDNLVLIN